jgi:hypothetical protein
MTESNYVPPETSRVLCNLPTVAPKTRAEEADRKPKEILCHPIERNLAYQSSGLKLALEQIPFEFTHNPRAGNVFQCPEALGRSALAAQATAVQPHHLRIGGGLVDEHKMLRIKHALFSHPAPARLFLIRAPLLRRAKAFF